jgi:hypothetical protein
MNQFFYAKFENGVAIEGIETFAEISAPGLVRVDSLPSDFLFKKYDDGVWIEVPASEEADNPEEGNA